MTSCRALDSGPGEELLCLAKGHLAALESHDPTPTDQSSCWGCGSTFERRDTLTLQGGGAQELTQASTLMTSSAVNKAALIQASKRRDDVTTSTDGAVSISISRHLFSLSAFTSGTLASPGQGFPEEPHQVLGNPLILSTTPEAGSSATRSWFREVLTQPADLLPQVQPAPLVGDGLQHLLQGSVRLAVLLRWPDSLA